MLVVCTNHAPVITCNSMLFADDTQVLELTHRPLSHPVFWLFPLYLALTNSYVITQYPCTRSVQSQMKKNAQHINEKTPCNIKTYVHTDIELCNDIAHAFYGQHVSGRYFNTCLSNCYMYKDLCTLWMPAQIYQSGFCCMQVETYYMKIYRSIIVFVLQGCKSSSGNSPIK